MKPSFLWIHILHTLFLHTTVTPAFSTTLKNFPKCNSNLSHLAQTTHSHDIFSPFHFLFTFGSLASSAGDGQYCENFKLWLSWLLHWLLLLTCYMQQRQQVKLEPSLQGSVRVSSFLLPPRYRFAQVIVAYCLWDHYSSVRFTWWIQPVGSKVFRKVQMVKQVSWAKKSHFLRKPG